jgi:hypothetical protein
MSGRRRAPAIRRALRLGRLGLATVAAAGVLLLADARPAAADNCSGLSDCYFVSKSAVTVTVGLGTVAVVLLLAPPVSGSPDVKPVDPEAIQDKPPMSTPRAGPPTPTAPGPGPGVAPGPDPPLDRVKVVGADGTTVERSPKPPRPVEEEAAIRSKVRQTEQAVTQLPRHRQKAIFEEAALAAGRDQEFKALAAAIGRAAPPEEWIRLVNPSGDKASTVTVVNAVDAALDKVPRIARPGGALTADAVAAAHGSTVTVTSDLHDIGHFLAKAGPGARGVVAVRLTLPESWANATQVDLGHAFNAANLDGRIVFVDPQTGTVAGTPHDLLVAAGHDLATVASIQFVPTHPRFT